MRIVLQGFDDGVQLGRPARGLGVDAFHRLFDAELISKHLPVVGIKEYDTMCSGKADVFYARKTDSLPTYRGIRIPTAEKITDPPLCKRTIPFVSEPWAPGMANTQASLKSTKLHCAFTLGYRQSRWVCDPQEYVETVLPLLRPAPALAREALAFLSRLAIGHGCPVRTPLR